MILGTDVNKAAALPLVLILLVTLFEAATLQAKAEPKTIVVEGDWMRIQGAISSASPGDTVFVKKGTYAESTIVIDKAITLLGEDANTTVISNTDSPTWDYSFPPSPATVAIQINADNVKVSGFTIAGAIVSIAGSGDGTQIIGNIIENDVYLRGNNQTALDNRVTASFRSNGSYNNITGNTIAGNNEGLVLEGSDNIVYGNILLDGLYTGRVRVNGDRNLIFKNTITNSSTGVNIDDGSNNSIYENIIINNRGGITLGKGYGNVFFKNYVANNGVGASIAEVQSELDYEMFGSYTNDNRVYHNNFVNNTYQVGTGYRVYGVDFFDDGKEGNYWSDYAGNDTNLDGIGDTPYIIDENRRDNFPLMYPFDIADDRVVLPSVEPSDADSGSGNSLPLELIVATVAVVAVVVAVSAVVYLKKRRGVVKNV